MISEEKRRHILRLLDSVKNSLEIKLEQAVTEIQDDLAERLSIVERLLKEDSE